MQPSPRTGHHWLLPPHSHETPAEGKLAHLASLVHPPCVASQKAISHHPFACEKWSSVHVGSGVCWKLLRATQSICQLEQGGRKGGDGWESGLKGPVFSMSGRSGRCSCFRCSQQERNETEHQVSADLRKGIFTTSSLSFSSMNWIMFLICIIRWGTSGHLKGKFFTFWLITGTQSSILHNQFLLFVLFFTAKAATINCN